MKKYESKPLRVLSALMLVVAIIPGCSGNGNQPAESSAATLQADSLITEQATTLTEPVTQPETTSAEKTTSQAVTSTKAAAERVVTVYPQTTTATPTSKPTSSESRTTFTVPAIPVSEISEVEDIQVETLRYHVIKETHTLVTYTLYSDGSRVNEKKTVSEVYNRDGYSATHKELVKNAALNKSNNGSSLKEAADLTNDYRRAYKSGTVNAGLRPLIYDSDLSLAACIRAEEMAYSGVFAHERPDGGAPQSVLDDIGYEYTQMGENLARDYDTPDEVFTAWIESPEHHKNIIERDYTKTGIGYAVSPEGTVYWVQLFA